MSGSCWRSRKAENSNIQSLELATLRPCHGEAGGAEGDGVGPAGDSKPKAGRETRGTCPYLSSLQMSSARTGENQWSVPSGRTEPVRDPAQ